MVVHHTNTVHAMHLAQAVIDNRDLVKVTLRIKKSDGTKRELIVNICASTPENLCGNCLIHLAKAIWPDAELRAVQGDLFDHNTQQVVPGAFIWAIPASPQNGEDRA